MLNSLPTINNKFLVISPEEPQDQAAILSVFVLYNTVLVMACQRPLVGRGAVSRSLHFDGVTPSCTYTTSGSILSIALLSITIFFVWPIRCVNLPDQLSLLNITDCMGSSQRRTVLDHSQQDTISSVHYRTSAFKRTDLTITYQLQFGEQRYHYRSHWFPPSFPLRI